MCILKIKGFFPWCWGLNIGPNTRFTTDFTPKEKQLALVEAQRVGRFYIPASQMKKLSQKVLKYFGQVNTVKS